MTRQAVWGCLLAATVHALPDCLVELAGVEGYVSTQVDVLSPKHDERYTEGEAIPLGLEVQAWPVDIVARRDFDGPGLHFQTQGNGFALRVALIVLR